MKLRNDFVTNSSSSSFIIMIDRDLDPQVRAVIDLILAAEGDEYTSAARPLDDCDLRDLAEANVEVDQTKRDLLIKRVDIGDTAVYNLMKSLNKIVGVDVDDGE